MAKRDVVNYYISVQNQYFEMLNDVQDLDKDYNSGKLSQEQFEQAQDMLAKLKENYDRLSYIVLLLNEPNKKSKKDKARKQNTKVYDYLKNSSNCYIKSENDDVLKQLKGLMRKEKHGN